MQALPEAETEDKLSLTDGECGSTTSNQKAWGVIGLLCRAQAGVAASCRQLNTAWTVRARPVWRCGMRHLQHLPRFCARLAWEALVAAPGFVCGDN